MLATARIATDH